MLKALLASIRDPIGERVTLLLNHVLATERVAMQRLRGYSGCCIELHFCGARVALPAACIRITPAGLLQWCSGPQFPVFALRLEIDATNPASLLCWVAGGWPQVDVQGDAQLAGDLRWLMDNVRWDLQDDLEQVVGRAGAHEIARLGSALGRVVRSAARQAVPGGACASAQR